MAYGLLDWSPKAALIAGTALSTTSLAVVYAVLVETGLNSDPDFPAGALAHFLGRYLSGIKDDVDSMAHPERLEKRTLGMRRMGAMWSPRIVARIRRNEPALRERMWAALQGADVLLTPATSTVAPRVGTWEGQGAFRTLNGVAGHVPYNPIDNATGQPAAAVPAGFSRAGLPLSVQLVAPIGGERVLLSLAAQIEAARPWADRRPPVS